jgi:hypothetical protein
MMLLLWLLLETLQPIKVAELPPYRRGLRGLAGSSLTIFNCQQLPQDPTYEHNLFRGSALP